MVAELKMERRIYLWVAIGTLFIFAFFMVFKAGSVQSVDVASQAVSSVQAAAQSPPSSYGGMVGGC